MEYISKKDGGILMKLKKSFSIVVAVIMLVSLLTGCSSAEWGFYNLSQEVNALKKYQVTGEMSLSLDNISPELVRVPSEQFSLVQSIVNKYNLVIDCKVDSVASKLNFTYYIKDKNTAEQKEIIKLQSDGNKVYIKVDELFNFIKSFGNEEVNRSIDQIYANVQYFSIDRQEMKEILTEAYNNEALAEKMCEIYFDFGSLREQNKAWQDLYKGLMENVYDEYEMGIVKEDNNKYTVSLTLQDSVNVFASFAQYSIDHIEEIGTYLKESIANLNDAQKQLLNVYALDADSFNSSIDRMVQNVTENKELYKYQIDLATLAMQNPSFNSIWEGTQLEYSFEKTKDNVYVSNVNGKINYNDSITEKNIFKGSFTIKETIKEIDSVPMEVPTGNVLTLREIVEIEKAFKEAYIMDADKAIHLSVDLDNGYYISSYNEEKLEEGKLNIKVIDSTSYLPLRDIGNVLGENIQWDVAKKQPYVHYKGTAVYLNARVIGGTSYIPSREFSKLGYQVIWDAKSNIVHIQ